MPIKNRFAEMLPEITAWRHDLHENPEIMFDVHRTAGVVVDKLTEFGCDEIVTGIGQTGVVGVIKGKANTSGKVIGLRADMDALPIMEETGADHASKIDGAMHACGHDGHTSMLLGAAKYLAETRNFDGTVVLIFQPAEEGGGGGREMVNDGMMDRWNVQEVYAMHCLPGLGVGEFALRPGPLLAAADEFFVTVKGKGGHAAHPDECVDAMLIASHVVVALQSIISRGVDPMQPAVVSLCTVEGDSTATNVISQTVKLGGTVRTFDGGVQDNIQAAITRVCENTAAAFGGRAEVDYRRGYPSTVNHPEQTAFAADIARQVAGSVNDDLPAQMGAEDFSFMLQSRPGAFIYIGNGDSAGWHHPKFDFNDEALPAGCSYFAGIVENRMPMK